MERIKTYESWLRNNQISRVIKGFLPTFIDKDASNIQLNVDSQLSPRTDGRSIWVSLIPDCLDEKYEFADWVIFLRAITAHEAQHINSSNFSDIKSIMDWYEVFFSKASGLNSNVGREIAKQFLNIVEDGRIEAIAVKRRPGMVNPIRYLNQVVREGTTVTKKAEDEYTEFQDFSGAVLSYAKTGLYAPGAEIYAGSELEKAFFLAKPFIDEGVNAFSSEDCRKAVEKLLKECTPYLATLFKNSEELQQSMQSPSQNEYSSSNESEHNDSSDGKQNPLRASEDDKKSDGQDRSSGKQDGNKGANSQQKDSGKDKNSGSGEDGKETAASGKDKSSGNSSSQDNASQQKGSSEGTDTNSNKSFLGNPIKETPLTNDEITKLREMAEKAIEAAKQQDSCSKDNDQDNLDLADLSQICASYGRKPDSFDEYSATVLPAELPAQYKLEATELRRAIQRLLTDKRKPYKGLRRGILDTSALYKTGFLENDIFQKKRRPSAGSCAFSILIDNSGSMAEKSDKGSKYVDARTAAAIIEDALSSLVPCKIALFSTLCGHTRHIVIKHFDSSHQKVNKSYGSLSITPQGCNCDSVHIRVAATELLKRSERKKVLIVLSDGLPSAYGSALEACNEVKSAVDFARKKGIIVVPIMFGSIATLHSLHQRYCDMYEKNIIACQPEDITKKLGEMIKNILRIS